MKQNMGSIDRIIRIVVGAGLIAAYFTHTLEGTLGLVGAILGGVFIVTSAAGFCPLYLPFGIKTCSTK